MKTAIRCALGAILGIVAALIVHVQAEGHPVFIGRTADASLEFG